MGDSWKMCGIDLRLFGAPLPEKAQKESLNLAHVSVESGLAGGRHTGEAPASLVDGSTWKTPGMEPKGARHWRHE